MVVFVAAQCNKLFVGNKDQVVCEGVWDPVLGVVQPQNQAFWRGESELPHPPAQEEKVM